MSRTPILRCTTPGCRTLTSTGVCNRHRAPESAPASPWDKITAAEWEAAAIKANTAFAEVQQSRDQRDARRADLEALQYGAERADRRAEQPIFSGELS